ncbi:MAG: AAA family ATPase [Proteobacteria bacterium]|nr:AAA family ATPase [Pseudomonadota bacterium]
MKQPTKRMIAACGKGGSGKTAVVALMTKHLLQYGSEKLLLIDADPTMNLPGVLGVTIEKTVADVRKRILKEARSAGETEKENIARSLDFMLLEALMETETFNLLIMGRPEAAGCYCPVNSLLRDGIGTLAEQFDTILIDGEAGVEQISRQVMKNVDSLVIVSDISNRGLQTAAMIRDVVESHQVIGYKKLGLVLNRVRGHEKELAEYVGRTGLDLIGTIPEDENVTRFDMKAQPLLELPDDSPASKAVKGILSRLDIPN